MTSLGTSSMRTVCFPRLWLEVSLTDLVLFLGVTNLFIYNSVLSFPQPVGPGTMLHFAGSCGGKDLVCGGWVSLGVLGSVLSDEMRPLGQVPTGLLHGLLSTSAGSDRLRR